MPKTIARSCPLCLSVDDPAGMLDVVIEHASPPQPAPICLCKRCVVAIMKAAFASDLIAPEEVLPDAPAGAANDAPAGHSSPAPEAAPALVPEDQPAAEGPALDRRESEVPAGGEKRCSRCERSFAGDELVEIVDQDGATVTVCAGCEKYIDEQREPFA